MVNTEKPPSLEYSRRIYDSALDWYKNADFKAQIILTLDGAFLAFLANSVFKKQDELSAILSHFGSETWFLLGLLSLALTGSILSAIVCLWSRVYSKQELDNILRRGAVEIRKSDTYKPEFMFFFQFISRLGKKELAEKLLAIDEGFEVEAMAHETQALAKNVMKKHDWVNRGFVLAGMSLIFFLAAAISYVVRVSG